MDIARGAPWRWVLGAASLLIGCGLPVTGGANAPEILAPAILAPAPGCEAAPAALLSRVAARRPQQRHRRRPQGNPADSTPPPQPVEPSPSLRHAYYTCAGASLTVTPASAGWRAVGPVRRS